MSKLTKNNRENFIAAGLSRSLNGNQLITAEKSNFTADNGFTSEAAALASDLSSACNKLNELRRGGKKMPKIIGLLETKIKEASEKLEALGYSVENIGEGRYSIIPQDQNDNQLVVSGTFRQ
ncbi:MULTISPECIES: hypothetical protein [Legionella]|uniref:Uncharacterized protein n=1 Tax=Legionella drozanskii LLAP-1 TaxID=1212489 RepID=A0A0W0SXN4_9GAMM|nr:MULTISPECIES: hypothetical protein [Legionella]KTC88081.1 hypothetical protein Ldro_1700 [Legionella drozanskii LLAP-1]PJE08276.1 MAG: hypothetical protein CK430_12710 [Legionella sp.]